MNFTVTGIGSILHMRPVGVRTGSPRLVHILPSQFNSTNHVPLV